MNALFIENGFAEIVTVYGERLTTTSLTEGRYVRIDDGRSYPQLCVGASRRGNTISYEGPDQMARECEARLYKTRAGFERAASRLIAAAD